MTKEEHKVSLPLAIVVAGALVAGAIYFGGSNGSPASTGNLAAVNTTDIAMASVGSSDHIIGSPDAQVVLVEYSDLECPFCKGFHSTLHQIVDNYQGKVAWVFRHFPIAELHSRAPKEAEAAECAADQGGDTVFWKYIDKVFNNTSSNDTLDPKQLPAIASGLGLDMQTFNNCLSSGKHTTEIQNDVSAAEKAGALGTPYMVILTKDGKKTPISGAMSYDDLKIEIDSLLK